VGSLACVASTRAADFDCLLIPRFVFADRRSTSTPACMPVVEKGRWRHTRKLAEVAHEMCLVVETCVDRQSAPSRHWVETRCLHHLVESKPPGVPFGTLANPTHKGLVQASG